MNKNYKNGRKAEKKVKNVIKKASCTRTVIINDGSRGAEDLNVEFCTGTKWAVQVKSSIKGKPKKLTSKEKERLRQVALSKKATPVIAEVTPLKTEFRYLNSNKKVKLD